MLRAMERHADNIDTASSTTDGVSATSLAGGAIRHVWHGLQFTYTMLWTAGWIVVALMVMVLSRDRALALRMASRCWSPGLLWGSDVIVEGLDRVDWSRPHLVVANHQSMIDICALFDAVPVPLHFLLKQEMRRVPFVGWYARATGMLFIERDSRRAGALLRRQAAALLRGGATLCLFPEGTRSRSGAVAPFKGGAFQSAIDADAQVVPVALVGTGDVLPVDGFFRARPGPIRVRIGTPLPVRVDGVPAERQQLARDAHAAVVSMLRRAS